ncbi:MAG: polyribonucleotide nucleotidyltransferase [Omnitrophica WOR_2 bacterium GWA2_47_8]|nr:MAG: polyribonucleotide nucleotidyltransferase [Omnitrophica WOR_2 bacterium GWA2_47_8]
MNLGRVEIPFGAQNLIIETGKLAKQANGAVLVTYGGTVVLVAASMAQKPKEGIDFFPLTVEYQERTYSAGRIPGGFFKREGRPSEKEILTSRIIDRPLRPLFPEGLFNEVQVVATVLSHDSENDSDVIALIGASAALMVSDIPFEKPIAGVRVAQVNNEFIVNPTYKQREEATLELVIAGHEEGINMIEAEGKEIDEKTAEEALRVAFEALKPIAAIQNKLRGEFGAEKTEVALIKLNEKLFQKVRELAKARLAEVYKIDDKQERENGLHELFASVTADMAVYEDCKLDDEDIKESHIKLIFEKIEYDEMRRLIFHEKRRADGRGFTDLRPLTSEVKVLPRTHGSSLFTRGQTQSLGVVTLGTRNDEQLVEALEGTTYRSFMLHYNFPSFSVGETKPLRGPGRREIGHGALAAKSLKAVLPTKEEFPYTIRVVSEILESNGSSSMATVCSGTLALMDAGVPIKDAVAGISIGLITDPDGDERKAVLLTDIMGMEDHFGDMDFKVAGTRKGITAIQLDLKISKISIDLLSKAMAQAKEARFKVLDNMYKAISAPRSDMSPFAPRIFTCHVNPERIGEIIGPGGKMIKRIIEATGVTAIDIEDDGLVMVAAADKESGEKAVAFINGLVEEPVIGKIYDGRVKKVTTFGAFVEFLPGREGLVHVSELAKSFVKDVSTIVKVGDEFKVKVIEIDAMKRINLSKKQVDEEGAPKRN